MKTKKAFYTPKKTLKIKKNIIFFTVIFPTFYLFNSTEIVEQQRRVVGMQGISNYYIIGSRIKYPSKISIFEGGLSFVIATLTRTIAFLICDTCTLSI